MTKVKICGITNLEDALLSAKFGADALGFNFYEKSPRYISPENAREIIERLPKDILKVGVFVNKNLDKIIEISETAKLDAIQLHGEETPEFVGELKTRTNLEIIKAFRVSPGFKPENVLEYKTDAILLDAYNPKEHGGTGETFDWEIAKKVQEIVPKMYLAGGLSQDNIANAILEVKPFAVDACSCLESEKGRKDKALLINFICNVLFSRRDVFNVNEDLIYILRLYRNRPLLYLPEKSITQLITFVIGFLYAFQVGKLSSEYQKLDKMFHDFSIYLGINRGMFVQHNYTFVSHYLEKSRNDEARAFDLFFAEFEEFLLSRRNLINE